MLFLCFLLCYQICFYKYSNIVYVICGLGKLGRMFCPNFVVLNVCTLQFFYERVLQLAPSNPPLTFTPSFLLFFQNPSSLGICTPMKSIKCLIHDTNLSDCSCSNAWKLAECGRCCRYQSCCWGNVWNARLVVVGPGIINITLKHYQLGQLDKDTNK